jgi:hypothetical protein
MMTQNKDWRFSHWRRLKKETYLPLVAGLRRQSVINNQMMMAGNIRECNFYLVDDDERA